MTKNIKHKVYVDALIQDYLITILQKIVRHSVCILKHLAYSALIHNHCGMQKPFISAHMQAHGHAHMYANSHTHICTYGCHAKSVQTFSLPPI